MRPFCSQYLEHNCHSLRIYHFKFLFFRWYIKAHEINPKNGRPYNQLAVLAVCAVSSTFMLKTLDGNYCFYFREEN